jgi:hypothetical protein
MVDWLHWVIWAIWDTERPRLWRLTIEDRCINDSSDDCELSWRKNWRKEDGLIQSEMVDDVGEDSCLHDQQTKCPSSFFLDFNTPQSIQAFYTSVKRILRSHPPGHKQTIGEQSKTTSRRTECWPSFDIDLDTDHTRCGHVAKILGD